VRRLPPHAPHISGLKGPQTQRAGYAYPDRVDLAALPRVRRVRQKPSYGRNRRRGRVPATTVYFLTYSILAAPKVQKRKCGDLRTAAARFGPLYTTENTVACICVQIYSCLQKRRLPPGAGFSESRRPPGGRLITIATKYTQLINTRTFSKK
jgi:hypothetical protein